MAHQTGGVIESPCDGLSGRASTITTAPPT